MKAYYGSRFSPNQTVTPEGFLICHNVPVARTGWYEYRGEEVGVDELYGQMVKVYRSPEEVFNKASIASFEGKILTDEHPPEEVTPGNATIYGRGTVTNVRQGSGDEADLLIADLVAYDQTLIDEIQEGKREVSCGYNCTYVPEDDGTYQQRQICGNHVAVVKSGRAGDRVAIKDSKTNPNPKGENRMAKKITVPTRSKVNFTQLLAAVGLKQFATDADPEEIMDAVNTLAEERSADEAEVAKEEPAKDADPALQALSAEVSKLSELVNNLLKGSAPKSEDSIDEAIAELEKDSASDDDDEEESHTVSAESMDDGPGPVSSPEDRPKSAMTGDNSYKIAALKAMKPIIAAIPDPAVRKRASDAAIASIKGKAPKNTYAAIDKGKKSKAADAKTAVTEIDHAELGRNIAKQYNPHYKNRI